MVVGVVEVDDVDAVEAEPVQALLQCAAYAVGAEVPDAAVGGGDGEAVGQVVAAGLGGFEAAAHLGGDGVRRARPVAQRGAETAFGQADAVVRGGVEVADAPPQAASTASPRARR